MVRKLSRYALLSTLPVLLAAAQRPAEPFLSYSQQGWSEADRNQWYSTSQGSRLMPLTWMMALERHQDEVLFMTPDNIARYRYIAYTTPTGGTLPVGFAEDRSSDAHLQYTRLRWLPNQSDREPWIGFTCAACHTGEVAVGDRRLRVDGAPGMGDFQSFVEQIDLSLKKTRSDAAKWARFAQRVLGTRNNDRNRRRLAAAMDDLIGYRDQVAQMNQTPLRYGFSRVDAFGHIFNQASLFTRAGTPIANPPNAPVSYPFLWNVPQHNVVQWNGSVANRRIQIGQGHLDFGAVGRNTGEVIGVFGEVVTRRKPRLVDLRTFPTSVDVRGLVRLETMLERLLPPAWPEDLLGRIDRTAAARGERIYMRDCASCHVPLERTDLTTPIIAQMSWFSPTAPSHPGTGSQPARPNQPPGTDPTMACNAYYYSAASGRLMGYKSGQYVIGEIAPVLDILTVTVTRALASEWRELVGIAFKLYHGGDPGNRAGSPAAVSAPGTPQASATAGPPTSDSYPNLSPFLRGCVNKRFGNFDEDRILGYKARPLGGIWATAPYLHNGSVPNLYELLLPPDRRSTMFWTGTTQYDAERVGYDIRPSNENSFQFNTRDAQGNVIWGNYNGGHDYNNAALDRNNGRDRRDLLEYLKTL